MMNSPLNQTTSHLKNVSLSVSDTCTALRLVQCR
jgi:hypothetical protein